MSTKFKVGDKARIIRGGMGTNPDDVGKIVTITGVNKSYGLDTRSEDVEYDTTGLKVDSISWGRHRYVGANAAFEKVEQPKEQEMKQEFKAGDKVRVTCDRGNNFKVGDIVTFVRKSPYSENSILEGVINTRHDSRYGKVDTQSLRPGQFEATFSLDKPLFTAEGTPVVLVTKTNPRDPKFPVLVYEGKAGVPTKYDLNGKAKNGVARRNLTNAVPKVEAPVTEMFVSLLDPAKTHTGQQVATTLYPTAEAARAGSGLSASRLGLRGPVGIGKVVLVSGRWPV